MQHVGAQVLGEGPQGTPALPAPALGRILQPEGLGGNQAHVDGPEVAFGFGLCRILGHLGWTGVRLVWPRDPDTGDFRPRPDPRLPSAPTLVLPHLAEASVGGEVVADGILPALVVVPEEGEHRLDLTDDLKPRDDEQAP